MKKLLAVFLLIIAITSPVLGLLFDRYINAQFGDHICIALSTILLFFASIIPAIDILTES